MVTELCKGKVLLHEIIASEKLSEARIATIFRQLLLALNYLHNRNIAHRDIKAENIMYHEENGEILVKLIDFGLGCHFDPIQGMTRVAGTRSYMAPEVLKRAGPYTQ